MQTTSLKFNQRFNAWFMSTVIALVLFSACRKNEWPHNDNPPASYSSEVIDKWMTMQLRLMKTTTGVPNQAFSRHYAYAGIAALESIAPGLHPSTNAFRKWNGLTGLPVANHSDNYYYPANVNAAMASITRAFYPNATAAEKVSIDSLENALTQSFLTKEPQSRITKSADFGKAVATAVFNWSETDGIKNQGNPYTVPVGIGLWKPTPPAFAAPSGPHWGTNRTVVVNSTKNADVPAAVAYSTDPASPFYKMVKHVYDVSLTLTDAQKTTALFWRDVPGVTSPGHWLSILQQAVKKTNAKLDKAVIAYALSGSAVNDAIITCWKSKYQYNVVRPITYIREVMGHTTWNSFIGTPPHPEYSSGHSSLSAAAAAVLDEIFGNIGTITDRTYEYMGFEARNYSSFMAMAEDASISRVYGGIHYKETVDAGLVQGKKVASNIMSKNLNH
jgi:hypothetical protein